MLIRFHKDEKVFFKLLLLHVVLIGMCLKNAYARETISFEAEHMIESQMNARYLALPAIPRNLRSNISNMQTAVVRYETSRFDAKALMLGWQYYLSGNVDNGFLFSGFADYLVLDGNKGASILSPLFVNSLPFSPPVDVNITAVDGDALHLGVSASMVKKITNSLSWQYGLVLEYYDVKRFAVSFDTVGLPSNFSGKIDFAETYLAATPYLTVRKFLPITNSAFNYSTHMILAWPLPRQGFSGRLTVPGFDQSGSTDETGFGKHIPDPFLGFGLSMSNASDTWRFDVGALVSYYLLEGVTHKGINNPIFINVTWKI